MLDYIFIFMYVCVCNKNLRNRGSEFEQEQTGFMRRFGKRKGKGENCVTLFGFQYF